MVYICLFWKRKWLKMMKWKSVACISSIVLHILSLFHIACFFVTVLASFGQLFDNLLWHWDLVCFWIYTCICCLFWTMQLLKNFESVQNSTLCIHVSLQAFHPSLWTGRNPAICKEGKTDSDHLFLMMKLFNCLL